MVLQMYWKLLESYEALQRQQPGRTDAVLQATVLMVLPPKCRLPEGTEHHVDQGIGFSRLCCQLVAYGSGLQNVWFLDDNIQQCFQLDYGPGMKDGKLYHARGTLKEISMGKAMQTLEAVVLDQESWKVKCFACLSHAINVDADEAMINSYCLDTPHQC